MEKIVSNAGVVKYRTGAELATDIEGSWVDGSEDLADTITGLTSVTEYFYYRITGKRMDVQLGINGTTDSTGYVGFTVPRTMQLDLFADYLIRITYDGAVLNSPAAMHQFNSTILHVYRTLGGGTFASGKQVWIGFTGTLFLA